MALRDDDTDVDNYFSQNVTTGNAQDYQRASPTSDLFNPTPAP
jgi:hypothetical protein